MRLDLIRWESWDRANARLPEVWPQLDSDTLRLHQGLFTAVNESALGLAQIFSHKRSIAVVKGNTWAFDGVLPWFLREAYQVQTANVADLSETAAIDAWARGLKKDTAVVLFAEDHPVTGATWDWPTLDRILSELKIFALRVSHSAFVVPHGAEHATSSRICSISPNLAVSVSGARWKAPASLSMAGDWHFDDCATQIRDRLSAVVDEQAVLAFERQFPGDRIFADGDSRLFDRAVLGFETVSGDALIQELRARRPELGDSKVATLNGCFWQSMSPQKAWWHNPPSPDRARGLVTFAADLVREPEFATTIKSIVEDRKARQSW